MAMFPIFIIGVVAGIILSAIYNMYREETPSETRFKMLEKELEQEKKDKVALDNLVDKLYAKIDGLEKELKKK